MVINYCVLTSLTNWRFAGAPGVDHCGPWDEVVALKVPTIKICMRSVNQYYFWCSQRDRYGHNLLCSILFNKLMFHRHTGGGSLRTVGQMRGSQRPNPRRLPPFLDNFPKTPICFEAVTKVTWTPVHRSCAPIGTGYCFGRGTAWWDVSEANLEQHHFGFSALIQHSWADRVFIWQIRTTGTLDPPCPPSDLLLYQVYQVALFPRVLRLKDRSSGRWIKNMLCQ